MNEINLFDENELNLLDYGYKWIGFNCLNIYVNVLKGFGGIGILVKNSFYKVYYVYIIDKFYEGILGVKFWNKDIDFIFVLYFVYLLLENFLWGCDVSLLFVYLFI